MFEFVVGEDGSGGEADGAVRQLVRHKHFMVNDRIIDIPSYMVSAGDQIKVCEKSRKLEVIHTSIRRAVDAKPYSWLELDKASLTGIFQEIPEREKIPLNAQEQMVVELYSK